MPLTPMSMIHVNLVCDAKIEIWLLFIFVEFSGQFSTGSLCLARLFNEYEKLDWFSYWVEFLF